VDGADGADVELTELAELTWTELTGLPGCEVPASDTRVLWATYKCSLCYYLCAS
jgi:hypothetical protein